MSLLVGALLRIHLVFALSATLAFWLAALAAKGGWRHRRAGHTFRLLIYAAAVTGAALAVAQLVFPLALHPPDLGVSAAAVAASSAAARQRSWFVLYVLLALVAPVQHGLAVASAGPLPRRVRSRLHASLNLAAMMGSVLMLPATILWEAWPYLIVTPAGFVIGLRNMSYATRPFAAQADWQREHLTSLISAGILLHTAFFVLAAARTFGLTLSGWVALVPWLAPAAVGLPLVLWWRRRIGRRDREGLTERASSE